MCVLVDANLAALVLGDHRDEAFLPVLLWLTDSKKDGCLVYGGKLATELGQVAAARRLLVRLRQAGRARQIPDAQLPPAEAEMRRRGCKSNDPHVLALANISGARTLCTKDRELQRDFKNPALVTRPRGRVYTRLDHIRLLAHTPSCGRSKRQERV